MKIDISSLAVPELLQLFGQILLELRQRSISRTNNLPTGEYAEYLFSKAFNIPLETNSKMGYDAIAPDGTRYQIKGRRITQFNKSRQLSSIRDIYDRPFDFIAVVLFDERYKIIKAALIPWNVSTQICSHVPRTNSYKVIASNKHLSIKGVLDVTDELKQAEETEGAPEETRTV
ncbi:MAG: hypothetical protein ABJO38_02890 [Stappiaceae bacterium]